MNLAYPVIEENTDITMMAWNKPYEEIFPKLKEYGYSAVELLIRDAAVVDSDKLQYLLGKNNLRLSMISTGPMQRLDHLFLMDADPIKRHLAVKRLDDLLCLGALLHAPIVIAKFRGQVSDCENCLLTDLAAILRYVDKKAGEFGIQVYIEPQSRPDMNNLNTIEETVSFITSNQLEHTKILMDIFHMNLTEDSIVQSIITYGRYIGALHLADTQRRIPGFGTIDFLEILKAIRQTGFRGDASIEVKQEPDSDACARLTADAVRYLERLAGTGEDTRNR
jgi:sugar phosphate isomerase/epimerase